MAVESTDATTTTTPTQSTPRTLFERLGDAPGPVPGLPSFTYVHANDPRHCGGVAVTVERTAIAPDEPLIDVLSLRFATGLDFTRDADASRRRFEAWLEDSKQRTQVASDAYQANLASAPDTKTKVAAAARLVQVIQRFAAVIARAEIPADVGASEIVDGVDLRSDKVAAYCDALQAAAEPLLGRASQAAERCLALAGEAGDGWWTRACEL